MKMNGVRAMCHLSAYRTTREPDELSDTPPDLPVPAPGGEELGGGAEGRRENVPTSSAAVEDLE